MSLISDLKAAILRLFTSSPTPDNRVTPPTAATPTSSPHTCRFRLDTSSSGTLTLPDGRELGYAQYGSLTGPRAILYQHGFPGSRLEAASWDELGLKYGVRIIATDRPGIGLSSPHPGRTLLDHAKDVEFLAEDLGLEEYCVMGISGGGPSALACAMGLPRSKLKRVSVVVGLGPPDIPMKGADWLHWLAFPLGFRYLGYTPIMRWFFQRGPEGRLDLSDEKRLEMLQGLVAKSEETANPKDLKVNRDEDILRLHLRSTREAFAQGFDGVTQDGRISCTDFGFRIEDIRPDLPVQLWYGKQDTFVPLWHGEQIAKRLGGRAQLRVEDETHGSIQINFKEEIFKALVRSP